MKFVWFSSSHTCPYCESVVVRRSRREGPGEFLLHWILFISPYRCRECSQRYFGWRFASPPARKGSQEGPDPSHPVATAPK